MYLYHFGLQRLPFGLTPDTGYFCALPGHRAALNVLRVALGCGEGFIKITGEVGSGKTLLCRKLLGDLHGRAACAWLPNPVLTPFEMRLALAHELGLNIDPNDSEALLIRKLELHLLSLAKTGRPVIFIIDEAQALPDESLEALRLLSNLETEKHKLVQIVLFGQPELDERLAATRFRQLRQRIVFSYILPRLSGEEMQAYLRHRLKTAGCAEDRHPLSTPALRLVAKFSRGIPRLGHILAHKALILAYGRGLPQARWREALGAALDTEDVALRIRRIRNGLIIAVAGVLATGTAVAAVLRWVP